ncbi:MAG TPA: ABC transporter permease, partial [Puia sp.]|nr:ABC transporter permease [Puia sp.]
MIKNFFIIAIRNFKKQKAFSFFNVLGLALGIACGLLLTSHIREELSYEKAFPKHDRIFRMVTTEWSKSSPPLAAELKKYFPEIQSTARFAQKMISVVSTSFNTQAEVRGYYADSSA